MGAATTGSGRYLTGDFIGADVVRNEITAQATAAAAINSQVDTIIEIGGQDSKFISLRHGAIVDFMMNKVCAAGTGSYLEEQAEKLGISIREEFGELALASEKPVRLGERCTVFMESDLVHHQQRGAAKADLVAGLSYSIVQNYLNKVAEDRPIGDIIFYQGATAANRGIVAAFQQVLGSPSRCRPTTTSPGPSARRSWPCRSGPGRPPGSRASTWLTGNTTSNPLNARVAPIPVKFARW